MKTKKAFKMRKRKIIEFYNYNIRQHKSFNNFQRRLERDREQRRLKLRHLKHQRRQVIASNEKGQVIYFQQLQKCYLWQKRNGQLIQLPKSTVEDKLIAYSYLLKPPLH